MGVDLGRAAAPDETTILRFRHFLEEHELGGKILATVNMYLDRQDTVAQLRKNLGNQGWNPCTITDCIEAGTETAGGKQWCPHHASQLISL